MGPIAYAYNRQGEPITIVEWCDLVSDYNYRLVALTEIGQVAVSTVWVGIEPGRLGGSMIFETRIRGGPWPSWRHEVERYGSESEALAGHELAIDFVSAATGPTN